MLGPEDRLNARIDAKRAKEERQARRARAEVPLADERTLARARELAALRRQESLSINDPFFRNIPGKKKHEHRMYVANMREKFAAKTEQEAAMHELSSAFEYVVAKRINESGWFGSMRAQLTTERDDIYNGVDLYVEQNGRPIGLSFDVTYTQSRDTLAGKLAKIKEWNLDRGRLAQLEYYVPLDEKKRREMRESDGYPIALPKVVIGVTREEMLTAVNRYYENRNTKPDMPSGLIMLYQTMRQLRHFVRYVERIRGTHPVAGQTLPVYKRTLEEVESVWAAKLAGPPRLDPQKTEAFALKDPFTQNLIEILDQMLPTGDT